MIRADQVSGVLVTRGDVDVQPILDSWPFREKIVYDNSKEMFPLGILGRWSSVALARNEVVYVQDDDCLVPVDLLLGVYDGTMLLNIPGDEAPMVGWGAVFKKQQAQRALNHYADEYGFGIPDFDRCADVIVTGLNDWERVDFGHTDLPWATAPDRMYRQKDHYREREEVRERCRQLRLSSPTTA